MGKIMSKKAENDENFKKYQERLTRLQQEGNLTPPPDLPLDQLISYLAAEGTKLLEAEEKTKKTAPKLLPTPKVDDSNKLTAALATSSKNPYVRARQIVLEKLPEWRKKELAEMEKTGNVNNTKYKEFVAEVAKLGDTLSEQK
jgi:hypothetical protein